MAAPWASQGGSVWPALPAAGAGSPPCSWRAAAALTEPGECAQFGCRLPCRQRRRRRRRRASHSRFKLRCAPLLPSRYDCEVVQRGSSLFMHFEGYPSDEDEPLHSLDSIRFSSLAAEPADCPKVRLSTECAVDSPAAASLQACLAEGSSWELVVGARWARPPCMAACSAQPPNPLVSPFLASLQLVPGLRVTGFKKSAHEAIWVDGEIVGKKVAKHPHDKCHCRWGWLSGAAAVATRVLHLLLWVWHGLCSVAEALMLLVAAIHNRQPCLACRTHRCCLPAASRCGGWTQRMKARPPSYRCVCIQLLTPRAPLPRFPSCPSATPCLGCLCAAAAVHCTLQGSTAGRAAVPSSCSTWLPSPPLSVRSIHCCVFVSLPLADQRAVPPG